MWAKGQGCMVINIESIILWFNVQILIYKFCTLILCSFSCTTVVLLHARACMNVQVYECASSIG